MFSKVVLSITIFCLFIFIFIYSVVKHYFVKISSCFILYLFIYLFIVGRFDVPKRKTVCSKCRHTIDGFDLANLLCRGFWPGDPDLRSSYIFDQKLLDLWLSISMNLPGSSLSGFLHSLEEISEKHGRVSIQL